MEIVKMAVHMGRIYLIATLLLIIAATCIGSIYLGLSLLLIVTILNADSLKELIKSKG